LTNIQASKPIPTTPYVGPISFSRKKEDQKRFFGRDYETDEIVSLILGHRLVLLYAQSGAGKTSIINAKITPELENYDYDVLPSARIGNISSTEAASSSKTNEEYGSLEIKNMYMLNAIQSLLGKQKADPTSLLTQELSDFLARYYPVSKDRTTGESKPQILVFDQLEELFSYYPNDKWRQQQKNFFEQVAKALKNNPLLHVVFVIREDYLAELDPFLELLPERLRPRFRLERLRKANAFLAIKKPLETMSQSLYRSFEKQIDADIDIIIDDLLKIKSLDPFSGKIREVKGEFVEPIHLQIVCDRWWQGWLSRGYKNFSSTDRRLPSVDEALKQLYESTIHEAVSKTKLSEETIRKWCEKKLITPSGTRGLVYLTLESSEDEIDSNVIGILESNHLIRVEWRSGTKWYELTHDRLIGPIKESNKQWKDEQEKETLKAIAEMKKKVSILKRTLIIGIIIVVPLALFFAFIYPHPVPAIPCFLTNSKVTLPIGGPNPDDIAVNPVVNKVYVTTTDITTKSANIAVIDCTTNTKTNNITLTNTPHPQLATDPQTKMVYVSNPGSNLVYAMRADGNNLTKIKNMTVGSHPYDIAVNPNSHMVYVTNTGSNTVSVIDGKTNTVTSNIIKEIGKNPRAIDVNPKTDKIYVANTGSNTVSVIDDKTNNVVKTIAVGKSPFSIAVDEKTNNVYVANRDSNTISVINGNSSNTSNNIQSTIQVGKQPIDLAVDYDQQKKIDNIYVVNRGSNTISVIDGKTNNVIRTVPLDFRPVSVTVDPESHRLYINSLDFSQGETISEINAAAVPLKTDPKYIQVGSEPKYIAINPKTDKIYVVNRGSNTTSVIDGRTGVVINNGIQVGKSPNGVAVNPQTNMVYVSNNIDNSTSVIDGKTNSIVKTLTVGKSPNGVAVNPQTNMVYVSNNIDNSTSVIDGKTNSIVKTIPVGKSPSGVAVNPLTDKIYVANTGSNNISVIDGKTNNVRKNIPVPIDQFTTLTVDPTTNMIYVLGSIRNQFFIINGSTDTLLPPSSKSIEQNTLSTIFLGGPTSMAINPNNNKIYATNEYFNTISATDTIRFPILFGGKLNIGGSPSGIAVDRNTNFIYVVNKDYNTVAVLKPQ
jgi:YVTN family beta-propeller protein